MVAPACIALAVLLAGTPRVREAPHPQVEAALHAALAAPGATLTVLDYKSTVPQGCVVDRAESTGPITGSARIALRLKGRDHRGLTCSGGAWAWVEVTAPVLVATRALRTGDRVDGAVTLSQRELKPGRTFLTELPSNANAALPIAAGAVLESSHLRATGPAPGEPVKVVVRAGGLEVERMGRSLACGPRRACATLGGKRVEGTYDGERLILESL